ncbi:hypothetical protein HSEST_2102 [Halapricum desulfuricans]|uniref:Uncharacterized protein n=1 Tax=Halapricum desulfuricans TaxID=2841257 RepID=A0A897NS40_9EURY|nr:hypothetical protein HSEST_2102 [Halapricum desulfuricans]
MRPSRFHSLPIGAAATLGAAFECHPISAAVCDQTENPNSEPFNTNGVRDPDSDISSYVLFSYILS